MSFFLEGAVCIREKWRRGNLDGGGNKKKTDSSTEKGRGEKSQKEFRQ